MRAVLVVALLISGCASTTVAQREANAIQLMAVGGGMAALGGTSMVMAAALTVGTASQPEPIREAFTSAIVAGMLVGALELGIGGYLLSTGRDGFVEAENGVAARPPPPPPPEVSEAPQPPAARPAPRRRTRSDKLQEEVEGPTRVIPPGS